MFVLSPIGTSHNYIADCVTVHLPCFVAYGIAKKTEDYIEAVYRWGTGALELFWDNLFSSKIWHFFKVLVIFLIPFAVACFVESSIAYYAWVGYVLVGLMKVRCAVRAYMSKCSMLTTSLQLTRYHGIYGMVCMVWYGMVW